MFGGQVLKPNHEHENEVIYGLQLTNNHSSDLVHTFRKIIGRIDLSCYFRKVMIHYIGRIDLSNILVIS